MAAKRDPDRNALALFADELRAARDRAGLTQDELAARVNYSTTLIAMVEGLKRVPQADLAARLDDVLATPGTFGRLQERLRVLPFAASFRPFVAFEETAAALRSFEHVLVPGLFADRGVRPCGAGHSAQHRAGRFGRAGRVAAGPSGDPGPR